MEELGGYRIVGELGRGGMGVVYQAQDPSGRTVALKSLTLGGGRCSTRARIRMQREAQALAQLSHPGLVPCYDCGEAPSGLFFVMGFVEGRSVGELLKEGGPLPVARALQLMGDVAETLAYVHGQGYLHRDLKPDNVMISNHGRTVLADFGMVKLLDVAEDGQGERLTKTGAFMGTPGFCSPEQAFGKEAITAASDVYGWGATLYCLISGQPPRDVSSMGAFLLSLREPATPISKLCPEVPSWLDQLLRACLAGDPAQRPSLDDVRVALRQAKAPQGTSLRLKLTALGLTVLATASLVLVAVLASSRNASRTEPSSSAITTATSSEPSDAPVATPDTPGAEVYRLLKSGQVTKAMEVALAWHEAEPTSIPARLACADTLMASGRAAQALPHAQTALQDPGLHPGAIALCGRVLLVNRLSEDARECLRRAQALDSSAVEVNQLEAEVALLDLDAQGAVDAYTRVLAQRNTAYVLSKRAWAYDRLGAQQEALADAEQALQLEPGSRHARQVYAHLVARWVDPVRGERLLRAFLADYPSEATAANDLEKLLQQQGRHAERRELLERPELAQVPTIQLKLGELHYREGRRKEADAAFARVLEVPSLLRAEALFFRGCLRFDTKQLDAALTLFDQSLAARPNHLMEPVIRDYRVRTLVALGRLADAETELERWLRLDPRNRQALVTRIQLGIMSKDLEAAAGAAQAFLEIHGTSPGPKGALAYVALAAYASSKGDPAAALQNYGRALELEESGRTYFMRGVALAALARQQEAHADFRRAVNLEPRLASAWRELMRSCVALDLRNEARVAAKRYLELGGGSHEDLARELAGE